MKKFLSFFCVAAVICCIFSGCSTQSAKDAGFSLAYTYDSHYSNIDEGVIQVYDDLCAAVSQGETSISVNNESYSDASRLFYICFPLSSLVSDINLNSDGSLRITYKETQSQNKELVEQFTDKVYAILSDCGYPDIKGNALLLNLYSYVAENVQQDLDHSTAYDGIISGAGSSSAYEAMFRYLVQQAGFSASRVYGVSYDGTHFLTEVDVDGELYYFDPCAENTYSAGKGLSYFGLGYIGLQQMGLGSEVYYSDDASIPFQQDSGRFDDLFQTVSYQYENGTLTAAKKRGSIVEIAL